MVCINISAKLSSIMFPFAILTLFVISADSEGRIYINRYKSYLTDVQNEGGGSRPLLDNVQKKDTFFIDGLPIKVSQLIPHNLPFGVCPSVEKLDGDETNNLAYRGPLNLVKRENNSKGT